MNLTTRDAPGAQQQDWLRMLENYRRLHPEEAATVDLFGAFVSAHADAADRALQVGHLTGAAWLVDRAGERVLLTHHRKLDRWLQLGGHADGDADLVRVALREAEEESGLSDLEIDAVVFDLDRHEIPARGAEPAHWHYDFRFVVHARGSESFALSDESNALAWWPIAQVAEQATVFDESMRRMARKWIERTRAS